MGPDNFWPRVKRTIGRDFVFALQKAVKPEKPSHGIIWVAKTYPPWQNTVLTILKSLYQVRTD